jgi:hypothetical protein
MQFDFIIVQQPTHPQFATLRTAMLGQPHQQPHSPITPHKAARSHKQAPNRTPAMPRSRPESAWGAAARTADEHGISHSVLFGSEALPNISLRKQKKTSDHLTWQLITSAEEFSPNHNELGPRRPGMPQAGLARFPISPATRSLASSGSTRVTNAVERDQPEVGGEIERLGLVFSVLKQCATGRVSAVTVDVRSRD